MRLLAVAVTGRGLIDPQEPAVRADDEALLRGRAAFGSLLIDQPLMRAVLADLALESEAGTALTLRLAGAVDRAVHGGGQQAHVALAAAPFLPRAQHAVVRRRLQGGSRRPAQPPRPLSVITI